MDPTVALIWIAFVLVGYFLGKAKGQEGAGFLAGFLLGPIGWLLVLCLPDLKKRRQNEERMKATHQYMEWQQRQSAATQQLGEVTSATIPPPPGGTRAYRIAKDGSDLGEISVSEIKQMLSVGTITMQDYYFDHDANSWMPLDCLPVLV